MPNKCLEISCYVAGAGAFGVFFRWIQVQMAFTENGLAEKSLLHFIVILYIAAFGIMFLRFVDNARNSRYYLPEDFCEALNNEGKLFTIARWAIGAIMCLGGLLLFIAGETDKNPAFMTALAACAVFCGISFPLLLSAANQFVERPRLLCLLSVLPVLMFSVWLITSYKSNDINSVVWAYSIEILTIIVAMLAFFYLAGFSFGVPSPWRSMFFSMSGAALCTMSMADGRYIGMQLMFLSSALMLILYNWIMFKNLLRRKPQARVYPEDGFERL